MAKIKDLKKEENTTLPAVPDDVADELAAWGIAANQNLRSKFLGTLLLYKKEAGAPKGGRFRYGEKKIDLPLGTRLIGIMGEARHGHRMWKTGQIVGEAIYKVIDVPYLNRNALGDLDEDNWPISEMSGKQEDPWQHYVYLPLATLDGKTFYTFSAKSYYGREAFYDLGDRYKTSGRQHVGQYPIIELGSEIIPSKKYGEIPAPTFTIVGWTNRPTLALTDESEAETANDAMVIEDTAEEANSENPGAGFGDPEIDF